MREFRAAMSSVAPHAVSAPSRVAGRIGRISGRSVSKMHIHVLGICGTFMGGVAAIARAAGHRVTGCDANVYPPMSDQLAALGIELMEGYEATQVSLNPDTFVVGNVVSRGNPLMEAILDAGLLYTSGPQWLAETVLAGKCTLAVAGTHGKTTTASMLAWMLQHGGLEPGFLIGGVPQNFGVSARLTESPFFVIEADEYDTAFFDKRSKFVHYRPRIAILNNLEFDHADIFADLDAIETQFHHLVRTVPGNGLLVSNARDPALERVLSRGAWTPVERFGDAGGWDAQPAGEDFDVLLAGRNLARVKWDVPGEHNRMNALAALAAARHAGVPPPLAAEALAQFRNAKRRLELRGDAGGVTVYDDFAHHPTAIRATLAALRDRIGAARVLAVLEPRSNTMKLGVWKDALAPSLENSDAVFCYTAGLGWDAAGALAPLGTKAVCSDDLKSLVETVAAAARPGDHVLVMSNGSFGGIHDLLLHRLRAPTAVIR
jgi:UDP-N-acetylmuramate: L-alanyl-gamma-D-glutamyl-meso-diaminopimelate ligase